MEKPEETPPETQKNDITASPPETIQVSEGSERLQSTQAPPNQSTKQRKKRVLKTGMNVVAEMDGNMLFLFRESLKVLKNICDEVPLEFSEKAVTIRSMDPSRVAMVNMVFQMEEFKVWDVRNMSRYKNAPLPVTVCVNIDDMLYCIDKSVSKNASVKLDLQLVFGSERTTEEQTVWTPEKCPSCGLDIDGNNNILSHQQREKHPKIYKCRRCNWRGRANSKKKKVKTWKTDLLSESKFNVEVNDDGTTDRYEVATMEGSGENVPLPKIAFEAKMKLVTQKLKEKLVKLKMKTDHVRITGSREGLIIDGHSDYNTIRKGQVTFLRGSQYLLDAEGSKQSAVYSLSYFPDFLLDKAKLTTKVSLEFTTDMPFRIKWETEQKHVLIEWFLAPRIETE